MQPNVLAQNSSFFKSRRCKSTIFDVLPTFYHSTNEDRMIAYGLVERQIKTSVSNAIFFSSLFSNGRGKLILYLRFLRLIGCALSGHGEIHD